jgi:chromosome partitioning protein
MGRRHKELAFVSSSGLTHSGWLSTVVYMAVQIAFVNGKGGVGKTTCSILFAAALMDAGKSVSLEDRDPQGNGTSAAIHLGIPQGLTGEDVIVIDTAPNLENPTTIETIQTADLLVLVTTPDAPDLSTTLATSRVIKSLRNSKTVLLFNRVVPNTYEFNEMPRVAQALPFPLLPHFLTFLRAYPRAHLHGWKALQPNSRAAVIQVSMDILASLNS